MSEKKKELSRNLKEEQKLKWLLYESGAQLEQSIINVLELLGFIAERFSEGESEFDVIFTSPEGRFIGEAEGRINKAIGIDKLRQLESNLQEDFARDEVSEYAKGVLFGNAYRLKDLDERNEYFTSKVKSGAKRSKIALVRTSDLFYIARYLKENKNADYAKRCRNSILEAEGEKVVFPKIPNIDDVSTKMKKD